MTARKWLTEISAAYADLGTFLPLTLGLVVLAGVDPVGLLFGFGLFALATAFIYRRPIPIQPMKATAAMGVAGVIGPDVLIATGILLGLTLILLSQTDLSGRLKRLIPRTVLHGMRVALALTLLLSIIDLNSVSIPVTAALLLSFLVMQLSGLRPISCLILLSAGWVLLGETISLSASLQSMSLPTLAIPEATAFVAAMETAFLPQLALTLTNALILTAVIAQDYFPDDRKPVTEKRLALSSGLANLLLAPIGAIPMCHGAGGLSAHRAMGSATGWSIAIFGATCLALAAMFGSQVTAIIAAVPAEVILVLLLFASWHLADPIQIVRVKPSCKLIIAGMVMVGLTAGLMTALVVGVILEWSITRYYRTYQG